MLMEIPRTQSMIFPLENENVNETNYQAMIRNFFVSELRQKSLNFDKQWLMQDGATPHTSKRTIACLKEIFECRIVSRKTPIEWPARSPDLNPCDFYLWGNLKSKVYENHPKTLEELKEKIEIEIKSIAQSEINNVIDNFHKRIEKCFDKCGAHLEK